jgi:tetratricopeptide (TPR) repeat protein
MTFDPSSAGQPQGWSRRRPVLAGALVAAAAVLAYLPGLRGGFVWDDGVEVVQNDLLRTVHGLWLLWFRAAAPDYLPLKSTVQWLAWHLWGARPLPFHILNLGLHAAGSVLVWRWLERLRVPGSWLAGLVFAIHPVNVESVAWISELKNTLSLVFFLLSLLAYADHEDNPGGSGYARSLGWFFAALLSKASVTPLPFVLWIAAYWRRGEVTRRDLIATIPFFALAAFFGFVTIAFQYHRALGPGMLALTSPGGWGVRVAAAGLDLGFYAFHAVAPIGLLVVYPKWSHGWAAAWPAAWGVALAGMLGASWLHRRTWGRGPLCALGYFVAMLLPVLGFLKMSYVWHSPVADHFEHLALVGMVALGAGLYESAARREPSVRPLLVVLAEVTVVVFLAACWSHERVFRDEDTLWQETLAGNPQAWAAYAGLGVEYYQHGDAERAASCFSRALEIEPMQPLLRNDYGSALAALGRRGDAAEQYRMALKVLDHPLLRQNLVQDLLDLGRYDEALEQARLAVAAFPGEAALHGLLGEACLRRDLPAEAASEARIAIGLDPGQSKGRQVLAEALKK